MSWLVMIDNPLKQMNDSMLSRLIIHFALVGYLVHNRSLLQEDKG